ncbi:MAG: DnaD domain protein [Oscillospiraceae bacterium]
MSYKINYENYNNNFVLPLSITNELELANEIDLKIILLIFASPSKSYSINLLSNLLKVDDSIIKKSIDFWIEKRVLLNTDEDEKSSVIVNSTQQIVPKQIKAKVSSAELTFLLDCVQSIISRPITSMEQSTIIEILEYVNLPADVVIMAIEFCVSKDKFNARYFKKVCVSWADNNITTHETAEKYLQMLTFKETNEAKITECFGIDNRKLVDKEKEFIDCWFNKLCFDIPIIKLAYEKTITSINKLSFPYINKILQTWSEKGYKNIDDITKNEGIKRPANTSYDLDEIDKYWDNVPKL